MKLQLYWILNTMVYEYIILKILSFLNYYHVLVLIVGVFIKKLRNDFRVYFKIK